MCGMGDDTGISPQNMANNMVHYVHYSTSMDWIRKFPLRFGLPYFQTQPICPVLSSLSISIDGGLRIMVDGEATHHIFNTKPSRDMQRQHVQDALLFLGGLTKKWIEMDRNGGMSISTKSDGFWPTTTGDVSKLWDLTS